MKKIAFFVVLALVLTTLAACGGSPNATSTSNYMVTMSGTSFDNTSLSIPKGSTVTFQTAQSGTAHNLVVGEKGQPIPENGAPDFGSGGQTIGPGQSWTSPPWNTAGTFHVTCTYHPTTMTMTITVTG